MNECSLPSDLSSLPLKTSSVMFGKKPQVSHQGSPPNHISLRSIKHQWIGHGDQQASVAQPTSHTIHSPELVQPKCSLDQRSCVETRGVSQQNLAIFLENRPATKKLMALMVLAIFGCLIFFASWTAFGTSTTFICIAALLTVIQGARYMREAYVQHVIWASRVENSDKVWYQDRVFMTRIIVTSLLVVMAVTISSIPLAAFHNIADSHIMMAFAKNLLVWAREHTTVIDGLVNVPKIMDYVAKGIQAVKREWKKTDIDTNDDLRVSMAGAPAGSMEHLDISAWVSKPCGWMDLLWAKTPQQLNKNINHRAATNDDLRASILQDPKANILMQDSTIIVGAR